MFDAVEIQSDLMLKLIDIGLHSGTPSQALG